MRKFGWPITICALVASPYLLGTFLMRQGRAAATKEMDRFCQAVKGKNIDSLSLGDTFTRSALTELANQASPLGTIEAAEYRPVYCQFLGRPCVAELTLRSRNGTIRSDLIFNGSVCNEADPRE